MFAASVLSFLDAPAPLILVPNIVKKDLSLKTQIMYLILFDLSEMIIFELAIGVVFL